MDPIGNKASLALVACIDGRNSSSVAFRELIRVASTRLGKLVNERFVCSSVCGKDRIGVDAMNAQLAIAKKFIEQEERQRRRGRKGKRRGRNERGSA